MEIRIGGFGLAAATAAATLVVMGCAQTAPRPEAAGAPGYAVDAAWPKRLPNNWIMGQVAGLAVDARDHVWVIQRPKTLIDEEKGAALNPPRAKCCVAAPPVMEFDAEGNLLRAWGGPGAGYEWPENEHGIYVDSQGSVWVGGNDPKDHQLIKFTPDGKFLMQVGRAGQTGGSNSTTLLGRPAHMQIDAQANELYVADGYGNKRVVVFDAATGAYKRHWGAYGKTPSDEKLPNYNPQSPQFTNPVHCVRIANDGLVYVCDRANNRVQVFRKDGTFVKQIVVEEKSLGSGSAFDMVFSLDAQQKYIFLADGTNDQVIAIERESGRVASSFGRPGRYAGEFLVLHNIGIDSMGNLYTAEVGSGKRAQKFRPVN
jgi:DNA-binding beta-propeller fold protein YncE